MYHKVYTHRRILSLLLFFCESVRLLPDFLTPINLCYQKFRKMNFKAETLYLDIILIPSLSCQTSDSRLEIGEVD